MPSRHILIVDDDPGIRETLGELFALEGYEVREAQNGAVALQLIAERRPALIVLDLMMPVMTGWDVLERLHEHPEHRTIPIVVISAGGKAPPDVPFISKPFSVEELLHIVRRTGVPLASHAGDDL